MRKKAVVFDLDGTLIDSLPDIAAAMNKVLAAHGLPTHEERAYRLFTGDGAMNLTLRSLGNNRNDMAGQILAAYAGEYGANSRVATTPYPGIAELLGSLVGKGLSLCVLSNKDEKDVRQVIAHYFPHYNFDIVRGHLDGVPLKPDPTALLNIVAQLCLTPRDFWYVGDTGTDMLCAAKAGMESIGVTWGYQTREEIAGSNPAHYADSAGELLKILLS
jgi:phosphoglycolate phosphatase